MRMKLFLLAASVAFAQAPAAAPAFEVASIKPSDPNELGGYARFLPGGRFEVHNAQLIFVIQQIYGVRDFQIVNDPKWITDWNTARFNIEARGDESATEPQVREMAKALLAERFQLKVHKETRDLPVYALIPAKTGIKLAVAKDDGRPRGNGRIANVDRGWLQGTNVTMPSVVQVLSTSVNRPIVDKTNFAEAFDFRLTWTPDSDTSGDGGCPASFAAAWEHLNRKPEPLSCPSIFTAVQEQLGLKLDPQKAPIEVLVIDHVERPSAN
jgi:bla regulator protein blaR1